MGIFIGQNAFRFRRNWEMKNSDGAAKVGGILKVPPTLGLFNSNFINYQTSNFAIHNL